MGSEYRGEWLARMLRGLPARGIPPFAKGAGFSLFELVVFIIAVAIIYATAANRFGEFPEQAERASFLAVITQIQAGVNLEMMLAVSAGRMEFVPQFASANPMELLLEPPRNYLGEFDLIDRDVVRRRSWYFDRNATELVYLASNPAGLYYLVDGRRVPTDEVRFRLELEYRYADRRTGLPIEVLDGRQALVDEETERRVSGLLVKPVVPFEWIPGNGEALIETALTGGGLGSTM